MPRDDEKELQSLWRSLDEADRHTLLSFARFLGERSSGSEAGPVPPPAEVPRDENESVVGAIKRLSATYHMLDKSKMLNETSSLVAEHTLQGRPREEVIEELEVIFRRHYQRLIEGDDR